MLKILSSEESKGYKKIMRQNSKRGQVCPNEQVPKNGHHIQVYMYNFMYIYTEKIQKEEYIPCTNFV